MTGLELLRDAALAAKETCRAAEQFRAWLETKAYREQDPERHKTLREVAAEFDKRVPDFRSDPA